MNNRSKRLLKKLGQAVKIIPQDPETPTVRDPKSLKGIMTDKMIKDACERAEPLIAPFVPHQVRVDETGRKIISYGLSSMGYDVTLDRTFKVFTNMNSAVIDPLDISDDCYFDKEGDHIIIPPNGYALGVTNEYFKLAKDELAICVGKSTYARSAAIVNVTPIEPGFHGRVVIEIANLTNSPLKIYANMGIAQFLFFKAEEECEVSYGDRKGKYQGQNDLTTARV